MTQLEQPWPASIAGSERAPQAPVRRPVSAALAARWRALPRWLPGAAVTLCLTAPAWAPILDPRYDLMASADTFGHLLRTWHLQQAIAAGDWYPRWTAEFYGGYGYPTLNFYAPLTYYLLIGFGAVWPTIGLAGAFRLLAAVASISLLGGYYALGWRLWRGGPAALLATGAVAYAPYVIQANLFLRGGLPELLGLAAVPWLLVAAHGLWASETDRPRRHVARWWWLLVALAAALLVTHSITALLGGALVAGWLACLWLWRHSFAALVRTLAAAAVGASLTAFVWLPAVLQVPSIQMERAQRGMAHYRNWFIAWPGYHAESWGLPMRSPFTVGFPIDLHLAYPNSLYGPPRLSLWQGMLILVSGAAGAAAIIAARRLRRGGDSVVAGGSTRETAQRCLATAALAYGLLVAVAGYALNFDWALPIWERFAFVRVIQFPNRLFADIGYGVALAAGSALALWARPTRAAWLASAAAVALIGLSTALGRPLPTAASPPPAIDAALAVRHERELPGSTASMGEYLPRTATYDTFLGGEARGFWLYERVFPEASWLGAQVQAWQGNVALRHVDGAGQWTSVDVVVAGDVAATVAFHQLGFSGWRAWVDGHAVPVTVVPRIESLAMSPGFMLVSVPPGAHRVSIRFGPDALHVVCALFSLAAWLAVAVWCVMPRPVSSAANFGARAARLMRRAFGAAVVAVGLAFTVRLLHQLQPPTSREGSAVVVSALADAVQTSTAEIDSPTGRTLGPDKFVDVRYLSSVQAHDWPLSEAGTRTRRWVFTHPPARVSVDVVVPPNAFFQTGLGLDPAAWEAPLGDGVRFVATVAPLSGSAPSPPESVLLDYVFNPRAKAEQRRWVDVVADLRPWAGQHVRLTLRTEGRDDPLYDWAGWAEPAIVRLDPLAADRLLRSSAETGAAVLGQ